MMSNRRKSQLCDLSLILAAGLALGGCGSDSSTTTPAATPAPAASPAPAAPAPSLPVPAGLRVSATGPDFIAWSWEAVEGAEGYVVELGLAADFGAPAQTATVAATTHRFTVAPETIAWARVRAVTGAGAGRVASEWSEGVAGASAAADSDGDGVVDPLDAFPLDPTRTGAIQGISTTVDDQILVEVSAEDGYAAHPFDLNGRTLVFTPDGRGGYSRSVRPLAWEEDIGERIEEETEIAMEGFRFDFGGRSRDLFHVSRHGLLSFDGPLAYNYYDSQNRLDPMREIAAKIVGQPIVSPLFKPQYGGPYVVDGVARQHVAHWPDRVVVTWFVSEPWFHVGGIPPETPDRFQAVLYADGRIAFHYGFVASGDGIAGLFPNDGIARGRVLARIVDERNPEVRGYLDLIEVAIYETDRDAVIVEFTTRDPIPQPQGATSFSYWLFIDTDRPYWTGDSHNPDWDLIWRIVLADGEQLARGGTILPRYDDNRIALLADIGDLSGRSASIFAQAVQLDDRVFVQSNETADAMRLDFPTVSPTDLSQSDGPFTRRQKEVFHYRGVPDMDKIACRVIEVLGDRFDVIVFHSEIRFDSQEGFGGGFYEHGAEGIGWLVRRPPPPCGDRLIHRHASFWTPSRDTGEREFFDGELVLFAHEFTHSWTAYLSYEKDGEREPLFGEYCDCHWRPDLHLPAAFPWRGEGQSIMGEGGVWRENRNGTFTPVSRYYEGGFSWLDLYAMGLADAREVPDMLLLRNLQAVSGGGVGGTGNYLPGEYTADKEFVSIRQVVAVEGPRTPDVTRSQKDFNAGFLYLTAPGQAPSPDLLEWHAALVEKIPEFWFHITGGRSRITTRIAP